MSTDAFQDFSYATHWERFAGEIEQVLRRWLWTLDGALSKEHCTVELKQKLHFRKEPYLLSLELPGSQTNCLVPSSDASAQTQNPSESVATGSTSSEGEDFEFLPQLEPDAKSEKSRTRSNPIFSKGLFVPPLSQFDEDGTQLQRWFGVSRFVLLRAGSQSGRIADAQECSTLLSAAAVALSEFPRPLPIFLPVQNAFRDAYRGVAVMEGRSVFLDIDSSHLTQQSEHLRSVVGQLEGFAKQLQKYSPNGAQLCHDIACGEESCVEGYEVGVSACVTYKLPLPVKDHHTDPTEAEALWSENWDEGCVWQPWAAQKDPVASLELDLVWDNVELTPQDPTPVLSAMNAALWRVHALSEERHAFESWAIFSKKDSFNRRHLSFPSVGELALDPGVAEFDSDNFRSMTARLNALLQAVHLAEAARSVGDLGSEEWWDDTGTRGPTIPPEDVFTESLYDMFGENFNGEKLWSMTQHVRYHDAPADLEGSNRSSLTRLVPLDALTARLGLHAVVYRNARAVSLLWGHFVQVIRLEYWEKLKRIPLIPAKPVNAKEPEAPDLNACLIHQKLQMLNICIHRLVKKRRMQSSDSMNEDNTSEYESCAEESLPDSPIQDPGPPKPRGIAGILQGAFLEDRPDIPINIPITQLMPVHTSDSLIEEETLLSALHDSPEDLERAARAQAKVLLSDMAAFKAANPEAQLGDFVKWHSPKDWLKKEDGEGYLSHRMSHESDNRWIKLWQEVEPLPAAEQIPLFDPAMAGERALYFLETIEPVKLFWQLFQIALVACFGCLQRSAASHLDRIQQESTLFFKSLKNAVETFEQQPERATELLEEFKAFERSVVTGESLMRHLPGCETTIARVLDTILNQSSNPESPKRGILVPDSEKERILSLLLPGSRSEDDGSVAKALCGTVLQHEWVLTCRKQDYKGDEGQLCHRLYFKDAVNEVRLGTVVVSEL